MTTSPSMAYAKYNGTLLMRGSKAFELYDKSKLKELEEHLKMLDVAVAKAQGARK